MNLLTKQEMDEKHQTKITRFNKHKSLGAEMSGANFAPATNYKGCRDKAASY